MDALLNKDFTNKLMKLAEERALEYQTADPYPHIVIEDFLPVEPLQHALDSFPSAEQLKWIKYDDVEEKKLAFPAAEKLPQATREILFFLNSSVMLQFLEKITGIEGLISDPYFVGGGLHQIQPGGYLGVHADFNKYEKLNLDRRLNVIVYLNQNWREEYGGHLELWDREMTKSVKKVLPIFNRCVIFSTNSYSFHGHPEPLTCPPDRSRKSLATYYYSNGRPAEEQAAAHSTLFQPTVKRQADPMRHAKRIVRSLLPPIITDAYYSIRKDGR